jgi:hypothetical protein
MITLTFYNLCTGKTVVQEGYLQENENSATYLVYINHYGACTSISKIQMLSFQTPLKSSSKYVMMFEPKPIKLERMKCSS